MFLWSFVFVFLIVEMAFDVSFMGTGKSKPEKIGETMGTGHLTMNTKNAHMRSS